MATIKHDIWEEKDGCTMLCHSGDLGIESSSLLGDSAKLIHSFYAESHFDAMSKYYEFMNWGVYTTVYEMDYEPYKLEQLKKRVEWFKSRTQPDQRPTTND